MNPPAQTHHFALRRKLAALTSSPMAGEATSAQKKLARLEERFDFSHEPESVDLFNLAGVQVVAGDASHLFEFDPSEQDVASLVQWALENRYHLNTALRHRDWKTSLWIDAAPECLPALRTLCATIRAQFVTLWEKHAALAGTIAKPGDLSFLAGGALRVMACHETHDAHCIGWLNNQLGDGNNLALRIQMRNCPNLREMKVIGEQHETFEDTLP